MSTDAIVLLKNEHREIRKSFRAFENAGARAEARKGQLVDRIIELLTIHTYLENEVMYHMAEEEDEWFPKVRAGLGRKQLQEIGAEMIDKRRSAPRRPSQPGALTKVIGAVVD
jgi:hemerythrin-like domain-containing protein